MAHPDFLSKSVSLRSTAKVAVFAAMFGVLSACGGGSGSAPVSPVIVQSPAQTPPDNPTPPNQGSVTGVAMPTNVSVVTANNAD